MEGDIPTSKRSLKVGNIVNARAVSVFENKKDVDGIYGDLASSIRLTGRVTGLDYCKSSNGSNIKYVVANWAYGNGTTKKDATVHIGQIFLGPAPKEDVEYFAQREPNVLTKAGGFGMTTTVLAPGERAGVAQAIAKKRLESWILVRSQSLFR